MKPPATLTWGMPMTAQPSALKLCLLPKATGGQGTEGEEVTQGARVRLTGWL